MGDRFLTGWPMGGEWHMPGLEVVSAYVDQRPPARQGPAGAALSTLKPEDDKVGNTWDGRELTASTDQWALREAEFGVTTYDSIADALRCGGETLAVDAVLLIGGEIPCALPLALPLAPGSDLLCARLLRACCKEHGNYEKSEYAQTKYPRYEMFKAITDVSAARSVPRRVVADELGVGVQVFRADGRSVPIFNDKHLSWKWSYAAEMVALSKELDFPFMAGSSLPTAWRMPPVDMPYGAEVHLTPSGVTGRSLMHVGCSYSKLSHCESF